MLYGPREEQFHAGEVFAYYKVTPMNREAYTNIELTAIWELEVSIADIAQGMVNAYDWHEWNVKGGTSAAPYTGITHERAMALIARDGQANMKPRAWADEPEPPAYPCTLDHTPPSDPPDTEHKMDMDSEGWIHGDPDDYIDPNDRPDWDTEC